MSGRLVFTGTTLSTVDGQLLFYLEYSHTSQTFGVIKCRNLAHKKQDNIDAIGFLFIHIRTHTRTHVYLVTHLLDPELAHVQISSQKKKTGVIAPKRFVLRLKKQNEIFRSYMHQVSFFTKKNLPAVGCVIFRSDASTRNIAIDDYIIRKA